MDEQTRDLLARYHIGAATPQELVDWGVAQLLEGVDTKHLRLLAGLIPPLAAHEVENCFYRSLKDLGWSLPDWKDCLLGYVRGIAKRIVSTEATPADGLRDIYKVSLYVGHPPELRRWVYLDDNLHPDHYYDLVGPEWESAIVEEAKRLLTEIPAKD